MKKLDLNVGGHAITAWVQENGAESYVAIKPLCEALGVAPNGQIERIKNNPQFKVISYLIPSPSGRNHESICLPVRQVGMWICTLNANRVKPEIRARVVIFQESLQLVIHNAISGHVPFELIQSLQTKMTELYQLISNQQSIIERQQHTINRLVANQEVQDELNTYALKREASHAGSRLASQRKLNHLTRQMH